MQSNGKKPMQQSRDVPRDVYVEADDGYEHEQQQERPSRIRSFFKFGKKKPLLGCV